MQYLSEEKWTADTILAAYSVISESQWIENDTTFSNNINSLHMLR